ncbi:MAG: hypothetical protein R2791_12440 [Saprospiraceae bacterium]
MFKNIRDDLIDKGVINEGTAKSYFIESMLFRVPDMYFPGAYTLRFFSILGHLILMYNSKQFEQFICANGIDKLCSDSSWNVENVQQFLLALAKVRDETEL